MEKPKIEDLKPGMVLVTKERNVSGKYELFVLRVDSVGAKNRSVVLDILDVRRGGYSTQYWKQRDWEWAKVAKPNSGESKKIIRALFSVEVF